MKKTIIRLGIASAGAWRVPGEGEGGWWLISLVPRENSHLSLPHSPAEAPPAQETATPGLSGPRNPALEGFSVSLSLVTSPGSGGVAKCLAQSLLLTMAAALPPRILLTWGAECISNNILLIMGVPPPFVFG